MTDKELKRLTRSELLEILLDQAQEIEQLNGKINKLEEKLQARTIMLEESGSIAEASIAITNVLQEAQKAADIYLGNIKRMTDEASEGIEDKIKAQKEEAEKYASDQKSEADRYVKEQHELAEKTVKEAEEAAAKIDADAKAQAEKYWDEVRVKIQAMIDQEQDLKGLFARFKNPSNP